jgi:hypothetical protein
MIIPSSYRIRGQQPQIMPESRAMGKSYQNQSKTHHAEELLPHGIATGSQRPKGTRCSQRGGGGRWRFKIMGGAKIFTTTTQRHKDTITVHDRCLQY